MQPTLFYVVYRRCTVCVHRVCIECHLSMLHLLVCLLFLMFIFTDRVLFYILLRVNSQQREVLHEMCLEWMMLSG